EARVLPAPLCSLIQRNPAVELTPHTIPRHMTVTAVCTTATITPTPRRSNTVPKNMQRVNMKQPSVTEHRIPAASVTTSKRPSTLPEPIPKRRRPQSQNNPSVVSPRPKLKEFWHTLMDSAIQLYFGDDATLLSLNDLHTIEIASAYKKTLYQIALMNLYEAKSIYKRPNFDKARCLYFKDAFLALSAVWYLYSPMANDLFGNERTQEAKDLCYIPDLGIQSEDVQSIVKPLLEMMKTGASIVDLFDKTLTMHTTNPSSILKLRVLQSLFINVIRPLNGEQGSIATKISSSILAKVFHIGKSARKCDTILAVDGVEICNIEAKKENTSAADIAVQGRKNAKINKSILLQLEKYGIECPPFMNVHGMTATINSIKRLNDIWVVGPACDKIILPKTRMQVQFFLERDVYVLFNLLEYYHHFADNTYDAKQRYDYPVKSKRVPLLRQVITTSQLRQVFAAPDAAEEDDDKENNDDEKNNDEEEGEEGEEEEEDEDEEEEEEEEEGEEEKEELAESEWNRYPRFKI
ncbi:hypothetical protein BGZ46_008573, partial [Entomortierella lignicola]